MYFYISSGEKRTFPSPCKLLLLQRAVFLAASLLQLQYLWWLAHNNNNNPVCNFVVNLFSPGDLYWGSSNFRNQLFQVGSVNLSFCLHIWEHCQSSKSHDLLLASLPAMFLDIGWSSTCNNTSAQCCCIGPNGDHDHDGSWWVWMIRQEFRRIF
jgi:hypothetical protein